MEKTYRGTSMPKCDFNKVASQLYIKITLRRGFFPVNLLHIFRILFLKNTFGGLLLNQYCFILCLENIIHYPPYPKRHVQKTKIFILIYSFYLKLLKNDHEKIGFAVTFQFLVSTKMSYILKCMFKYVFPLSGHQAIEG